MGGVVRGFSPGYGACVMGTGIVAVVSYIYSTYISFLGFLALFFTFLNTVIAFIVSILWFGKLLLYPRYFLEDLSHPVKANFYPTLPIGLMVLAADYIIVLKSFNVGVLLWLTGSIITFILGIIVPYNLFKSETVRLDHINPSIFIPPVGLIVIPIVGGLALGHVHGFLYELGLFFNIASWGSGFFIYLALLAVCVYRFILHKPLPSTLVPTMWINLGPIGAGTVALNNLLVHNLFLSKIAVASLLGFLVFFWGSGVWWLLMAIMITLHYMLKKNLPYATSWWAFTFPLGAYVAATHVVYSVTGVSVIDYFGLTIYFLLLLLWMAAFQGTFCNLVKGLLGINKGDKRAAGLDERTG